jgi:hypothetical protein
LRATGRRAATGLATLLLTIALGWTDARAFDFDGYKSGPEQRW